MAPAREVVARVVAFVCLMVAAALLAGLARMVLRSDDGWEEDHLLAESISTAP